MPNSRSLRVADLFCGPGGLSEGMRLGGCEVVYGLDKAKDAVETFKLNHQSAIAVTGDATTLNPDEIPDFDILVGGPPCVNFSQSKGSRANVLEGLRLVQIYLRSVFERSPKYWIMENVPRIALHLPDEIPLRWIGVDRDGTLAVPVRHEFNCADYGVPQNRKRYLIGNYPIPKPSHEKPEADSFLESISGRKPWRNLDEVLEALGQPYQRTRKRILDPNYGFEIAGGSLADHYHDVDLIESEVEGIRHAKTEHPFMGYMPFPDDTDRPARTVVATQLGRETLVLETRKGRYRRATVRECATIQTFPIDYNFVGKSVSSRYRQAGDAVPPLIVKRIAEEILKIEGISPTNSSVARKQKSQPPPAVINLKKRRSSGVLPISKRFRQIVPGKEVRGSRIDWDNQDSKSVPHPTYECSHIVTWASRLHLGEGVGNKRETIVSVDSMLDVLNDYLQRNSDFECLFLEFIDRLDRDFPSLVPDATTLQAVYTRRHIGVLAPSEISKKASGIINEIFPRERFGEEYVFADSINGVSLPRKGLRVRIALGGLAAAYLSELTNKGGEWASSNRSLVFDTGDALRKANLNLTVRRLRDRFEPKLNVERSAVTMLQNQ